MKKLGILGGSFDPIHNGHLLLARDVYEQLGLEKIIFIPAYIAPHKIGQGIASAADRYNMVKLAVEEIPYFAVSDVEIRKRGVSYTVDTMKIMKQQYSDYELFFIVGADSVPQLKTWHKINDLLTIVKFAAVYRPGYDDVLTIAKKDFGIASDRIIMVHTPEYAVSSTMVREQIKNGKILTDMIHPAVADYIKEHQLYK